jgi:hypothetical protein
LHLDDAKPLIAESIQVQLPTRRGGGARETGREEAAALTLSALGTVNRWAGVKWKNIKDINGNPVAIAFIPGAKFDNQTGKTTLDIIQ